MTYALETVGLSKTYSGGIRALDNLDLQVKSGESLGFLGPNGAGKTTTIQILLNLIKPTKGVVRIFEEPTVGRERDILKNVGALVGMPGYYKSLTPEDLLYHIGKVFKMNKHEIRTQSNRVLDLVGLNDAKKRKIGTFSTGMKRRIGIAQIMVHDPDLIILDEPTNGLDPKGVREVRDLIKTINKEGKTIFMTTHNLNEVDEISSRVIFLNKGEKIGDQNLSQLRKKLGEKSIALKFSRPISELEKNQILNIDNISDLEEIDSTIIRYEGNGDTTGNILRDMVQLGLPVIHFEPKTLSLEDIYLRLYGGSAQ